jgi:hypothetical protein
VRRATNVYSMGFGWPDRSLRSVSWDTDRRLTALEGMRDCAEAGLSEAGRMENGLPGGSVFAYRRTRSWRAGKHASRRGAEPGSMRSQGYGTPFVW